MTGGRITDVGGRVELDARPGRGTEVRLWVPLRGRHSERRHLYGETDELGFHVARDPVHVHDLQATILHLLGFDHERLTYRHQGRDFRLTDVHGKVVRDILA